MIVIPATTVTLKGYTFKLPEIEADQPEVMLDTLCHHRFSSVLLRVQYICHAFLAMGTAAYCVQDALELAGHYNSLECLVIDQTEEDEDVGALHNDWDFMFTLRCMWVKHMMQSLQEQLR